MKLFDSKFIGDLFDLNYCIFIPETDEKEKLPLIVFLHGSGERGDNAEELGKIKKNGLPNYVCNGKEYPAIIVAPQCPSGVVWNNIAFSLKSLIDQVVSKYNVDTNRISITGLSMGGYGAFEMGLVFPGYFSAIAPICGGGMSWRCQLLKDTPVWAFHGDNDSVVPVRNSIEMVDVINNAGGNAKLTIFHNVGHCCWDEAYLNSNVVEWLINQRKVCAGKENEI